jgi:hypothetical protein
MGRVQDEKAREKKLIRAPEDLVDLLNDAAANQGKTFYKYVTEIFEQALEAEKMGKTLAEIIEVYKMSEISRKTGITIAPNDFLNISLNLIYAGNEKDLRELWSQTGKMYGLLLKGKFDDDIEAFIRLVKNNIWMVSDIVVDRAEKQIVLRFVTPSISEERSHLLLEFIEGALSSLDYQILDKTDYKGIIDVKISRIS